MDDIPIEVWEKQALKQIDNLQLETFSQYYSVTENGAILISLGDCNYTFENWKYAFYFFEGMNDYRRNFLNENRRN